jgi:hypothetical protein
MTFHFYSSSLLWSLLLALGLSLIVFYHQSYGHLQLTYDSYDFMAASESLQGPI